MNNSDFQNAIAAQLAAWDNRRDKLVAFQQLCKKHDGKPAETIGSIPGMAAAAQAIMDLPLEYSSPPNYRERHPRSVRVNSALITPDITYCDTRIVSLKNASLFDYTALIAAKKVFDAEYARMDVDATQAWLTNVSRIARDERFANAAKSK